MLIFLRCVGIINAAIWFGTAFFSCVLLAPTFTSDQLLAILPQSHSGRAMQMVLERYYLLQYWCGGIALIHLLVEWLYTGRPFRLWVLYLILGLLVVTLVGGLWLEPKVKTLHLDLYGLRSTPQQRQRARQPLKVWRDVSEILQYLMTAGLLVYLLQVTASGSSSRFQNAPKFKG